MVGKVNDSVAGLTPDQWEEQLEQMADDPVALAKCLAQLEHEMQQENVWMHENPTCGNLFKTLFRFFGQHNTSLEQLGKQIQDEVHAERHLKERYRSWLPGEDYLDRLFPYLKGFAAPVKPDQGGLQFPGFTKYKGIKRGDSVEVFSFYISDRFPGRDPANFHLSFDPQEGELVIERVYKMELPRIEGITTVGRAVTAELIADITTQPSDIRHLVIDNAANLKTREALIISHKDEDSIVYHIRAGTDPQKTPMGHFMVQLALEIGLKPMEFKLRVNPFGVLKIQLATSAYTA